MATPVYVIRAKYRVLNYMGARPVFGCHIKPRIFMKKESLIEQCYKRMKERHGTDTLVFFHVDESYEAYYDDARTLARTTGVPSFNITAARIPAVRIPEADMEACRNRLLDAGYTVCVSDVRGASGRHMMRMDE